MAFLPLELVMLFRLRSPFAREEEEEEKEGRAEGKGTPSGTRQNTVGVES